jgi:hypothetical protein
MVMPLAHTEEEMLQVLEALAEGFLLMDVLEIQRINYGAFRRWRDRNPINRQRYMRALEDGTHVLADDTIRIARDRNIEPQRAKVLTDNIKFIVSKRNRKDYGDDPLVQISTIDMGSVLAQARERLRPASDQLDIEDVQAIDAQRALPHIVSGSEPVHAPARNAGHPEVNGQVPDSKDENA